MELKLIEEGKYDELLNLPKLRDHKYRINDNNDGHSYATLFMIYLEDYPCPYKDIHMKIIEKFIPIMNIDTVDDKNRTIIDILKNETLDPIILDKIIKYTSFDHRYGSYFFSSDRERKRQIYLSRNDVLGLIQQQAIKREKMLEDRLSMLESFINEHLMYRPDGIGALNAKEDFSNLLEKN